MCLAKRIEGKWDQERERVGGIRSTRPFGMGLEKS